MVDYSKWKKIEISDDEDDTHPNIDTPSLFRWRHKARLERMEQQKSKREELTFKLEELSRKLSELDTESENREEKEKELSKAKAEVEKELANLEKCEKKQAWNVDTIGQEAWSHSAINRKCFAQPQGDSSQEEDKEYNEKQCDSYQKFISANELHVKQFAFQAKFDDSRRFLLDHPELACEHTLDYLSLWCMQLKLDCKTSLLNVVARQTVIIQMILDLARAAGNVDPRSCLASFFNKAKQNWDKFNALLEEELKELLVRVGKAADLRIQKAIEEQEASGETEKILGPGGLDPTEVFQSLPVELQQCFESRNPEQFREALSKMDPEKAAEYLQRCIDSGLWVTEKPADADEELFNEMMMIQKQTTTGEGSTDFESSSWDEPESSFG